MPPEVGVYIEQMRERERRALLAHARAKDLDLQVAAALEAQDLDALEELLQVCEQESLQLNATTVQLALQYLRGGPPSPPELCKYRSDILLPSPLSFYNGFNSCRV